MQHYRLVFVGLILLLQACTATQPNSTNPKAPKESYRYTDKQVKSERYPSMISVPFEITMAEVERQLNANLQGVIYEDNSYDDDNQDNFMCRVTKLNAISATAQNNTFLFNVPLKIWVSVRFGLLGVYQTKETEFAINLKLNTKFSIDPTWQAHTETTLAGYDWISKPVVKLGPVQLPVTSIISKVLNSKKEVVEKGIDEAVQKNIEIKKYVLQAWNTTLQPMNLSDKYRAWLKVTPLEIQMTPLQTVNNRVRASIGIQALTETVFGERPEGRQVSDIPNLKVVPNVSNDCQIGVISEISHNEAARLMSDTLVGQKFSFNNNKYTVEVTSIDLYGTENQVVIKAGLKGSINGNIFFKGVPMYDVQKKAIYLDNFNYDLETQNLLIKTANWLLQGSFAKRMKEALTIPIGGQIEEMRKMIQSTLTKNQVAKGVLLDGKIESFTPDKVYLTPNSIIAVVMAKGRVELKVDGL
ncbi:MAG: DUF4403 family protein [Spirosomataceae bacterium]